MPDFVRARCRFISVINVVTGISLGIFALLLAMAVAQNPQNLGDWLAVISLLTLAGAMPVYWLVARRRGCIEVGADCARWRTAFGAWKRANWDQIEGVDARITQDKSYWTFVVHTKNGAFSWTNGFEQAEQLAPLAARFCARVPADLDAWPRRFDYRSGGNFVGWLGIALFGVWLLAALKWLLFSGEIIGQLALYASLYGWPLTLAGAGFFGFIILGTPALMLALFAIMTRDYWRHRGEVFVLDARGLHWRKAGAPEFFAAWDELQTLHIEARGHSLAMPHYRLQTARGDVQWNNALSGKFALIRLLEQRAPSLKRVSARRLSESLSAAPAGELADGEVLRFDYKTRSLRALLALGILMSVLTTAMAIHSAIYGPIPPRGGGEPMPTWAAWLFAAGTIALTSLGIWVFARAQIVISARGIERRVLRETFIAWEAIESLQPQNLAVVACGRAISLLAAGLRPAHLGRLLEIIEARATNAPGGWQSSATA